MTRPTADRPVPIVAVLAGGASKRMGQDKALMTTSHNNSLLALVCTAACNANLDVIVVGRTPDHLPADMPAGCLAIPDIAPRCGPLGGLLTALTYNPNACVILCACDVPRVNSHCFSWMIQQYNTMPEYYDGLLPQWQGRDQPLFALYKQTVASAARHLIETGQFAMKKLYSSGDFLRVDLPGAFADAVTDWDTPEDVRPLNFPETPQNCVPANSTRK